eukprot:TRINITY_DN25241_c1_g5_i1.p1 TRINITY_DN25241_c1_g5~~TRINITY_DN25241_c1_g5_i1.p1  ORF type:complete len:824 (+),score=83.70 TRINITY_DN25241_c1_g5_i1:95-2566(+)
MGELQWISCGRVRAFSVDFISPCRLGTIIVMLLIVAVLIQPALASRVIEIVSDNISFMIDPDVHPALKTHDRFRWSFVLSPFAGLLLLTVVVVSLMILLRSQTIENGESNSDLTGRLSLATHPLLVKHAQDDAVRVLHPETRIVDDIVRAITYERMGSFFAALMISCILAALVDVKRFAIEQVVKDIPDEISCNAACQSLPLALCNSMRFTTSNESGFVTTTCAFKTIPEPWKVDTTLISFIVGMYFIIEGISAELILVGLCSLYGALGIITVPEAFAGLSNPAVVGLALLFPVAAAVEETGVLDTLIGLLLGNPKSINVALVRMIVSVASFSAIFSNTAVVSMMIPMVVSWSRSLGVSPGKLLMPLSFAAQLGGTCTLIGSSCVLVAKNSVNQKLYNMEFFDLTLVGSTLAGVTSIAIMMFLPWLSSSNHINETSESDVAHDTSNLYCVGLTIGSGSSFVGMDTGEVLVQLKRLPGVKDVHAVGEQTRLEFDDKLLAYVEDVGVVSLRQVRGINLCEQKALRMLGMERSRRHLYEVVLDPESSLINIPLDIDAMRQVLGACPIALRGRSDDIRTPQGGDILLLEADERYVNGNAWQEEFKITKKVLNSSPPRFGGVHDLFRALFACLGMLILILAVTLDKIDLACGSGLLAFALVMTNSQSMMRTYDTVKAPILLAIAAASGLSTALQRTGIASFVAMSLTEMALPYGTRGVKVALYVLCASLSVFVNNSATIAIVAPMLEVMAAAGCDANAPEECLAMGVKSLTFIMIFASGTCLVSPLGYQTNMMVVQDGGYAFKDFAKYGSLIQIVHMSATIVLVNFLV